MATLTNPAAIPAKTKQATYQVYLQIDQNNIIRYVGSCINQYNRESVHKVRLNAPSEWNGAKSTDYEKHNFILAGNKLDIVFFPQYFERDEAIYLETMIFELLKPYGYLFNKRSPNKSLSNWLSKSIKGILYDNIVRELPEFEDYFSGSYFALPVSLAA